MTPERAQELLDLFWGKGGSVVYAIGEAPTTDRSGFIYSPPQPDGSRLCEHERGMTKCEGEEIGKEWNKMPGHTCLLDALWSLANPAEG